MPPKRARGAARGRGRGVAPGPAAPLPPAEPGQPTENLLSDPSSATHRSVSNTTPENIQDEDPDVMQLDPNDSPATQPTETPASTPVRPPPSLQMQSSNSLGGSGTRGGGRGRAKESKFKPKNVRRSAVELKALADQERERVAAIAADAARLRGRGNVFRGRAGRGRGDAMGRGRGAVSGIASGPFSAVPELGRSGGVLTPGNVPKRESGASTSHSIGTSAPSVKSENKSTLRFSHAGSGSKSYIPGPQYPDEDDSTPRIDIQHISLISSDEDEELTTPTHGHIGKRIPEANSSKGGLKPVRLDRQEHKERKSQVNTGPSMKDMSGDETLDSDTPMVDEERSAQIDRRTFKGAYIDEDVQVKDEPDEEVNTIDQLVPAHQAASSAAELNTRTEVRDTGKGRETVDGSIQHKQKKKPQTRNQGTRFVIQTEEDRREFERHLEDLEVLKEELGGMHHHPVGSEKGKEVGDAVTDTEKQPDKKEGRLYLFQFPPVMPKLYNPATTSKPQGTRPNEPGDDNVRVTAAVDKNIVDLERNVKLEGEEIIIKREDDEPAKKRERERLADEEGYVGKLIVRESGRVELDWGGSRMLVGRGIDTSFLSMGVLVDSKGCFDNEGKTIGEGVSTGMGKIMGKFVVTPDWESMVEDIERGDKRERRK